MPKNNALSPDIAAGVATDALNAINREIMRQNELDLARSNTAVDFNNVGTFAERIDRLMVAIGKGLECLNIEAVASAVGVFPISDNIDIQRPALLFYSIGKAKRTKCGRLYAFPPDYRNQHRIRDKVILDKFVESLRNMYEKVKLEAEESLAPDLCLVAAPYLVHRWGKPGEGRKEEEFKTDEQIMSEFHFCGQASAPNWPWVNEAGDEGKFAQKLVLLLLVSDSKDGDDNVEQRLNRHLGILNESFRHAIGAFLSTAGITADENAILRAQRAAAHSMLRAHDIGNHLQTLASLQGELRKAGSGQAAAGIIDEYRNRVNDLVHHISQLQGKLGVWESVDWPRRIRQWQKAYWPTSKDGSNNLFGHSKDSAAVLRLDIQQAENEELPLFFVKEYFPVLLKALMDNTIDEWNRQGSEKPPWEKARRVNLKVEPRNGSSVALLYRSTGSEIPDGLRHRLFREPVRSAKPGDNRGTALWGLGLAFNSYGLSYPTITNTSIEGTSAVEFEFLFPVRSTGDDDE